MIAFCLIFVLSSYAFLLFFCLATLFLYVFFQLLWRHVLPMDVQHDLSFRLSC